MKSLGLILAVLIAVSASAQNEWAAPIGDAKIPAKPVKIGLLLPLTGIRPEAGYQILIGANAAQREINGDGPEKLRLLVEDDRCDKKLAAERFGKFVKEVPVDLVIGPVCRESIAAIAPLAAAERKAAIALLEAGEDLEKYRGSLYAIGFSAEQQGVKLADYLLRSKLGSAAVIVENRPWEQAVRISFGNRFESRGGQIVALEERKSLRKMRPEDFRSAVERSLSRNPQVFVLAVDQAAVPVLKLLAELKVTLPVIGPSSLGFNPAVSHLRELPGGVVFAAAALDESRPAAVRLKTSLRQDFGEDLQPLLFAALGYDAVRIGYRALLDGGDLQQGLEKVDYQDGVIPVGRLAETGIYRIEPQLVKVAGDKVSALD